MCVVGFTCLVMLTYNLANILIYLGWTEYMIVDFEKGGQHR